MTRQPDLERVSSFSGRSPEHECLAASWGLQRIELHHARKVIAAADRLLECFNEFDADAPRFCGEYVEALDAALDNYKRICGDESAGAAREEGGG